MRQRERAGSGVKNVSQQVGCNVQIWSDCLRRTRDQKQMRWTCPFSPFVRAASSGEPPLSPTFNMSDRDKIYLSWASFWSRIRRLQSQSILNFQKVGTDTWSPGRSPTVLTWRWCLSCEKPLNNDKSSCYGAVFCWMLWELRLVLPPWVSRVCWFDPQNESSGPSFETQPSQKLLLHAA
jgi:hypothetical protein